MHYGSSESSVPRFLGAVALVVLVATLAVHVYAVVVRADREPHMDENEYLHAGWLMANGGRLYETFFEHHSPLFFRTLEWFAPKGERLDVRPYFVRTRWLCGIFGFVALLALVALLRPLGWEAAAIGVALLIATGTLWLRSLLEVRAETFAIAFFLVGTAMAIRWRGIAGGVGVGIVAFSCFWQPKWPLACVVVALVWFIRSDRKIAGTVAALAVTAAGVGAIVAIVPLDSWWFFNFEANVALTRAVVSDWVMNTYFRGGEGFLYVPDALHPWIAFPAALLVAAAATRDRRIERIFPLLLFVAAFLELRFIHPWPAIWSHYYLMWSIGAAMVLAAVPSSLALLLEKSRLRRPIVTGVTLTALLLVSAHVIAVIPVRGDASSYWVSQKYLREQLRPGETIWIEASRHPVSVRDAHYYWFSVGQMVGVADELRKTPRGARFLPPTNDLPVCALPEGFRYTLDPRRSGLAEAGACMERLIAEGRVRKTVIFDVWEVRVR